MQSASGGDLVLFGAAAGLSCTNPSGADSFKVNQDHIYRGSPIENVSRVSWGVFIRRRTKPRLIFRISTKDSLGPANRRFSDSFTYTICGQAGGWYL
jgi:hypothetical protein